MTTHKNSIFDLLIREGLIKNLLFYRKENKIHPLTYYKNFDNFSKAMFELLSSVVYGINDIEIYKFVDNSFRKIEKDQISGRIFLDTVFSIKNDFIIKRPLCCETILSKRILLQYLKIHKFIENLSFTISEKFELLEYVYIRIFSMFEKFSWIPDDIVRNRNIDIAKFKENNPNISDDKFVYVIREWYGTNNYNFKISDSLFKSLSRDDGKHSDVEIIKYKDKFIFYFSLIEVIDQFVQTAIRIKRGYKSSYENNKTYGCVDLNDRSCWAYYKYLEEWIFSILDMMYETQTLKDNINDILFHKISNLGIQI